jgi:hypothetical protein
VNPSSFVFRAGRGLLAGSAFLAWCHAWAALAHAHRGVPWAAALGTALALLAGLGLDVARMHPRLERSLDLAIWRGAASVGALLGSSLAFPPTSVPVSALGVVWFVEAAALIALGIAADVATAFSLGARSA